MKEENTAPRKSTAMSETVSRFLTSEKAQRWIVWIGLAGMLLLLLSVLFDTHSTDAATTADTGEDYAIVMEQKLREMALCVEGVSDCRVLVTLESGSRYVYEDNDDQPLTSCEPTVRGVVVMLKGPVSDAGQQEVKTMVKTALHLTDKRVCVVCDTHNET